MFSQFLEKDFLFDFNVERSSEAVEFLPSDPPVLNTDLLGNSVIIQQPPLGSYKYPIPVQEFVLHVLENLPKRARNRVIAAADGGPVLFIMDRFQALPVKVLGEEDNGERVVFAVYCIGNLFVMMKEQEKPHRIEPGIMFERAIASYETKGDYFRVYSGKLGEYSVVISGEIDMLSENGVLEVKQNGTALEKYPVKSAIQACCTDVKTFVCLVNEKLTFKRLDRLLSKFQKADVQECIAFTMCVMDHIVKNAKPHVFYHMTAAVKSFTGLSAVPELNSTFQAVEDWLARQKY